MTEIQATNKFESFQLQYDTAIKTVQTMLSNPDMKQITQFLLDTDVCPYDIFHEDFAKMMSYAEGFTGVLHLIHHALVDDGDICFPVVDGQPMIAFCDEQDFVIETVLSKAFRSCRGKQKEPIIVFIDTIDEFIREAKAFHKTTVKRQFMFDARRQGLDFAIECYNHYNDFSDDWVTAAKLEKNGVVHV
jgi:hypothetical protein